MKDISVTTYPVIFSKKMTAGRKNHDFGLPVKDCSMKHIFK